MKRFVLALTIYLGCSIAHADVPVFAARCGPGLTVDSRATGKVYLNSKEAKTVKRPDGQISANSAGAWVDITPRGGEPPRVTYTDSDKTTGTCAIVSFGEAAGKQTTAPAVVAPGRPSHAERAGLGKFDARGTVACARQASQPMGQCEAAVARDPGGDASVKITHADGRTRFIFFRKGKAVSADLSQADGDMTFRARKTGDLYKIRTGRERYEFPEAFVFGG